MQTVEDWGRIRFDSSTTPLQNVIQYRITRNMADDRKKGISFSFSKKVTTRKNILNSDDARTKEEETDYINAAEGKGLIR